jgi:hypothetical protein
MNRKILPWLLLICALGLSTTAAYYSIIGLSIVFSAVAIPVIIMGSFLEASKLVIATYLHNQWKNTLLGLKIYLTIALIILSFITSVGIYGLLSHGFNENIARLEVSENVISNITVKKDRYESIKSEKLTEQQTLTQDISNLRDALSSGTRVEYKDRETGEIIRTTSSSARKTFETQLSTTLESRDKLNTQIDALNDSITKLELKVLELQTDETLNGELGVVKYLSETLNQPIKTVATWLILLLIFVFDPLAICLVVATNHAFKNLEPKKNIYGEKKEKSIWDKVEELKKEGKLPEPTEEDIKDEPTALANSQYRENLYKQEIDKINKSGYSAKKRKQMMENLDSKTY